MTINIKHYNLDAINRLIARYEERGGQVRTIEEGVLGWGTTILYGDGLKTAVIQERYLNEWSSTHTIRFYNLTPVKYLKAIS